MEQFIFNWVPLWVNPVAIVECLCLYRTSTEFLNAIDTCERYKKIELDCRRTKTSSYWKSKTRELEALFRQEQHENAEMLSSFLKLQNETTITLRDQQLALRDAEKTLKNLETESTYLEHQIQRLLQEAENVRTVIENKRNIIEGLEVHLKILFLKSHLFQDDNKERILILSTPFRYKSKVVDRILIGENQGATLSEQQF